jgi:serine O-acetyltransferase
MLKTIKRDIRSVFTRDPAARSLLEVLTCYPGLHAVWGYRLAHWFWIHGFKLIGRIISQVVRGFTGIEIHPGAKIGPGLFIDHGMEVVIGETSEIGEDVTLYHGVTLGGTSLHKGKRHPTLEDCVVVGTGAKILGAITVGESSRVGANAVVVRSVPPDSVVIGVPGEIVVRSRPHPDVHTPDLEHSQMPDVIGETLQELMKRVGELEGRINGHAHPIHARTLDHGVWTSEDFEI